VIRPPAVAGTFYPAAPDVLERQLTHFMSDADNSPPTGELPAIPKAIIAPHAGYVYSGPVAARAYARLAPARGQITRVVLIGPSHHLAFRGLAVDMSEAWQIPGGAVVLDHDAIARLRALPLVGQLDAAHEHEHALEVHVPFLRHVLGDISLVPIVAGNTPPDAVAALFDAVWGGSETLIVVSTDLSHYLDYAACQAIDARTAEAIERFDDSAIGSAEACGQVPTRGLLRTARRRGMAIERLDLRNSGDTAGTRDRVVGYGAWALFERPQEPDPERAEIEALGPMLIDLVRGGIAMGFNTGQPGRARAEGLTHPVLAAHGATFVTLRRNGLLRGCIGSPVAYRPLAQDVVEHAFNAAFRDPRFPKLALLELTALELSVSVLTPPTPMRFEKEADLLAQLRPGEDGLIIEDAGRRSLYLPSVWQEIANRRHFLRSLKMKAGLRAEHFSPSFQASRFRSIEVKGRMGDTSPSAADGEWSWTAYVGPANGRG